MAHNSRARNAAGAAALALLLASAPLLTACGRGSQGGGNGSASRSGATQPAPAADDSAKLHSDIERLERQVERNPADEETRRELARAYVRRGDEQRAGGRLRESVADYQSALRLDPDNAEAQKNVAAITEQLGGTQQGENGEPAPLPITPNVADEEGRPSPSPTPKKQ